MGNTLFVVLTTAATAGLILMCGALYQIKRHGFDRAMARTDGGQWSFGRILFAGALVCFAIAITVTWFD